jgi:adenosylcobinamide-GDP ribazoletransferase
VRRALGFLTVFGGASTPDPTAVVWFPLVGALIGLLLGALWWGADQVLAPPVAAALVVVGDLVVTGLLHVDGLADSGDGLLAPMSRERRLAVMADPSIGAFGTATVAAALLLRFGALASLTPQVLALGGLWCASRTVMAVALLRMPYARQSGLASSFRSPTTRRQSVPVAVLGGALAGVLAGVGSGGVGLVAVAGVFVGGVLVLTLAQVRLGGFTGDVLGAAGVVGETVGLVLLTINVGR